MGRNCLPQEGRGNVRRARTDGIHLFWMGSVRGFACLTCEQFSLTSHLHLRDPKERTVSSWSSCLGRPQPGWRHPSQTQKSQQSLSFWILLQRTRGAGLGWQLHNLSSLLKINGLFTQTEWTLWYVNYTLIKLLKTFIGKIICTHTYIGIQIYIHMCILYGCTFIGTYPCIHIHTYICAYIYAHMYLSIYT